VTICIFMEDSHKKSGKALVVLARKIIGRQKVLPRSLQRGELMDPAKLMVHLANLSNPGKVSKVIVCIDSHSDPGGMRAKTSSAEISLNNSVRFHVKYVIVVHALETWLLQDPKAIRKVLGVTVATQKLQEIGNNCRPDRALMRVCGDFKKSIDDERIAREVDVKLVESQNSSFKEFVDALRDP